MSRVARARLRAHAQSQLPRSLSPVPGVARARARTRARGLTADVVDGPRPLQRRAVLLDHRGDRVVALAHVESHCISFPFPS